MIKNKAHGITFFICMLSPVFSYGMLGKFSKAKTLSKPMGPITSKPTGQPKPQSKPIPTQPTERPKPKPSEQPTGPVNQPTPTRTARRLEGPKLRSKSFEQKQQQEEFEELERQIELVRADAPYADPHILEPFIQEIRRGLDNDIPVEDFAKIFKDMATITVDLKAMFVDPSATDCIKAIKQWENLPSLSKEIIITPYPDGSYLFFTTTDGEPYPAIIHNLNFYTKYSNPTIVSLYSKIPNSQTIFDYDGTLLLNKRLENQANKFFKSNLDHYKQIIDLAKALNTPEDKVAKAQHMVDRIESGEEFAIEDIEKAHDNFLATEKHLQKKQSDLAEKAAEEEKTKQEKIKRENTLKEKEQKAAQEILEQERISAEEKEKTELAKKAQEEEAAKLAEIAKKNIEELNKKTLEEAEAAAKEQSEKELLAKKEAEEENARLEAEKQAAIRGEQEKEEQEIIAEALAEKQNEQNALAEIIERERLAELEEEETAKKQELAEKQAEREALAEIIERERLDKLEEERLTAEQALAEKQAEQNALNQIIESERLAKLEEERLAVEKELAEKQAERKSLAEIIENERLAKLKEQEIITAAENEFEQASENALQEQVEKELKEKELELQAAQEKSEKTLQALEQEEQDLLAQQNQLEQEQQTKKALKEQEDRDLEAQAEQEIKEEMEREEQERRKLIKTEKQTAPKGIPITQPVMLTPIELSEITPPESQEEQLSGIVIPEEKEKEEKKEEKKETLEIPEIKEQAEEKSEGNGDYNLPEEKEKTEEIEPKKEGPTAPTEPTMPPISHFQPTEITTLEPQQQLISAGKQQAPEKTAVTQPFESITSPWVPTETLPQYPVPTTLPPQPTIQQLQPWPIPQFLGQPQQPFMQPQEPWMQQPWAWQPEPRELPQITAPTETPAPVIKPKKAMPKPKIPRKQKEPKEKTVRQATPQPQQAALQPYQTSTTYATLPGSSMQTPSPTNRPSQPSYWHPTPPTASRPQYTPSIPSSYFYPSSNFIEEQVPQPETESTQPVTKRITTFFSKILNRVRQPAVVLWERLELVPRWIVDHYRQMWGLKKIRTRNHPHIRNGKTSNNASRRD